MPTVTTTVTPATRSVLPVLYSFRRCPYAMRARLAIAYAGVSIELREVELKNKPDSMLAVSPKGTVPVLILENEHVIDESYDVMRWALSQSDPDSWWDRALATEIDRLVEENDLSFKVHLDHYKYADRYPEYSPEHYRSQGEAFLQALERQLNEYRYLLRDTVSFADIAIFPFIRQFAFVDKGWFDNAPYPKLQQWLNDFLAGDLFSSVMKKYTPWQQDGVAAVFPEGREVTPKR